MKNRNRFFATLIAIVMVLTYMPGLAYAEAGDGTETGGKQTITVDSKVSKATADVDIADSDALLMGYMEKSMEKSATVRTRPAMLGALNKTRGSKLQGNDKAIYNILKSQIADIASGKRTDATIMIPLQDINPDVYREYYTAADLGVDAIVAGEEFTDEAIEAMFSLYNYDFDKIFNALLADMPYEMYWFDKTAGCMHGGPEIGADEYTAYFSDPYITFYFSGGVAEGYRGERTGSVESDDGATVYLYSVARTDAVTEAVVNAKNIRDKYAGDSDLNKLTGYKDEICALASYNDAAAEDDTMAYGDPGQLIWVFDDNSSTEVVCEGYAKAFQFLCDNTSFKGAIKCDSVTGLMGDDNGAGPHMWNILHMDDNNNYIADITNSDTGFVGEDGELFMCPPASFSDIYSEFAYDCSGSPANYKYDDDTLSTFGEDELVMAGTAYSGPSETSDEPVHEHTPGQAKHESEVAATCTAEGYYDSVVYCTECGDEISRESVTVPAAGHRWNDGEITTPATETSEGVKTYRCTVCGATKTETIPVIVPNPQPAPAPAPAPSPAPAPAAAVTEGQPVDSAGSTYVVTSAAGKTVAFAKAKNARTVTVPDAVMIGGESYKVNAVNANAFKGSKIRNVVIGKNVKRIGKNAFKGSKAATVTVKTKLLTRAGVKGSLKGSKVKTVKVNISKKLNKSYVSKYKKFFTKANAGAKVTVK